MGALKITMTNLKDNLSTPMPVVTWIFLHVDLIEVGSALSER